MFSETIKPPQTILTFGLTLELITHLPISQDSTTTIASHLRTHLSVPFFSPASGPYTAPTTLVTAAGPQLIPSSPTLPHPVVDWIGDHPSPRHYLVTTRHSLHRGITDAMAHHSCGIVVETPILRAFNAIDFAVTGISAALGALGKDMVEFTPYCGLCVHMGRRGGFSLDNIKGLAKAVVVFERDIEIAVKLVGLIEELKSVGGISKLLCEQGVGEDYKYNFQSLVAVGCIEFRQAQGTLDVEWIQSWVRFLALFVKSAEKAPKDSWEEWARGEGGGLAEFLKFGTDDTSDDDDE
ncbi:uncharacterized protein H6S33_002310 [Morchella sextelata]|uniref:uncharacterized protein n=1 Tax=Morchella sextelata TaxID=1174677 RepID=UPI001D046A00|nr:uncharacterized protein H6S33_002310 [Morchella sextelata]KAH0608258.1 hypothetical protein H6S33_002310 [Morchella sextelata]